MQMFYMEVKISDVIEEAVNSHLKYRSCVLSL